MNIETANRLLQYRKSHGFSQEELAEKIGVSRQAISKWERAEASPDTDNLITLAEVYGVTLDELLQGEGGTEEAKAEPDKNTTYVKDERFKFKKDFHVNENGDSVHIGFKDGINVKDKDGSYVHVGFDGIHVQEGEKVRAYTDENGHFMVDEKYSNKKHKKIAHVFPVWMLALIAMLLWGFSGQLCGFALSWICLLAIPLYHSFVEAIYKRNAHCFAYPVLCVVFQMITGFLFDGWSWGWIAYLTIPIYYCIVNMINKNTEE
ncbi:MAG: helix-turn-helix domain-containing protein [Ruminococcus sp.]|nr:helix-turn-helix domain-containing protein [Ruminococcus sp.]